MNKYERATIARVEYRIDGRGTLQILMIDRAGRCFFCEATPDLIYTDYITQKFRMP